MNIIDTFPHARGNKTAAPAIRRCEAIAEWTETAYLARSLVERGFIVTDGRCPRRAA
jgi:hypothetical protein